MGKRESPSIEIVSGAGAGRTGNDAEAGSVLAIVMLMMMTVGALVTAHLSAG